MDNNNLYNLKLNQEVVDGDYNIKRVPGGWLYRYFIGDSTHMCFVPYNKEFKPVYVSDFIPPPTITSEDC